MNELEVSFWLTIATHDSETAELIISNKGHADIGIYHIHQASEKLLKALFIKYKLIPPKIHFLDKLTHNLQPKCSAISNIINDILLIDKYLPKLRYPTSDDIKFEELIDCWEAFNKIKSFVYNNINS